ncbi:unnamed protein product, partial [Prorocentrum cordatum]
PPPRRRSWPARPWRRRLGRGFAVLPWLAAGAVPCWAAWAPGRLAAWPAHHAGLLPTSTADGMAAGGARARRNRPVPNAERKPWGQQRGGPAAVPLDFEVSAQEMGSVSQGLTLQGAQQVLAILKGVKLIENRSWKIPLGWYAIHAGSKLINEERGARTREAWPEVPPEESLPHGAILGLFCVHRHLAPQKCRPGYIWARGPVCHLISKAIELPRPIFCSGGGGLWSLPPWALAEIGKQLPEASVTHFDLSPALPVVLRN